jgi:hypothetical protein
MTTSNDHSPRQSATTVCPEVVALVHRKIIELKHDIAGSGQLKVSYL